MNRHMKAAMLIAGLATVTVLAGCTETRGTPSAQQGAGQGGQQAEQTVMVTQTVTDTVTASGMPESNASEPAPAVVTTTVTTTLPAGGSAGSWCQVADLDIQLTAGGVAAGSIYRSISLTNAGASACDLGGFPYVFYVTAQGGDRVGSAAVPSGVMQGTVTLQPGQSAQSRLRSASDPAGVYGTEVCQPVPVAGVELYVPGNSRSTFVPLPAGTNQDGCQTDPNGQSILMVRAIRSS